MTNEPVPEVRSPHPGEWIRVNPNPKNRREVMLFVDEGKTYLVAENMVEKMRNLAPDRLERKMLFIAQNRDGITFFWPVPAPVAKKHLAWRAMDEWICFPVLH